VEDTQVGRICRNYLANHLNNVMKERIDKEGREDRREGR
jgi:hypothetical protein